MATYTTNLNLKKPAYTDPADIADINSNMDTIDSLAGTGRTTETVKGNADDLAAHTAETLSLVTSATRDATIAGTQNIILGFRPKMVQINATIANSKYISIGTSSGASSNCVFLYQINQNWATRDGDIIRLHTGSSDHVYAQIGFNNDGFTLTWFVVGTSVTGSITMLITALRHGGD